MQHEPARMFNRTAKMHGPVRHDRHDMLIDT
jgi:hypothetical protein